MTPNEFFQALIDSGLFSKSGVEELRNRLAFCDDTAEIAAALQDEGLLTSYQINQLLAGCGKDLVLGQYHITAELGRGGFGRVYQARHAFMHRMVALKVILPELVENPRAKNWFRREMLAATQFVHPNIVMAFDANEVAGRLFLVLEYVDGQDLDKLVRDRGPLTEALSLAVFRQAAIALDHASRKGMVHRDIKPGNMLILGSTLTHLGDGSIGFDTDRPIVKLTDFGLARLHQQSASHTLAGFRENGVVGTPEYISPEQARDIHSVDIRSDLYSLGCAWYYALTGRPPFRCPTHMETILRHLEAEPTLVESLRPDLSPATSAILKRLLAKKPSERFQTPRELIDAIDAIESASAIAPRGSAYAVSSDSSASGISSPTRTVAPPEDRWAADTVCVPELAFSGADDKARAPGNRSSVRTPSPPPSTEETRKAAEAFERLRERWTQWLAIVDDIVEERDEACPTRNEYRAIREDVLASCRLQERIDSRRAIAANLADSIEPWFSLEALTSTDRETLRHVLIRRIVDCTTS